MLLGMELKGLFRHPRGLHLIPLALAGIFLTAWVTPVASPFVPVVLVVFIGLEPQFNNILFRTPREFESLSIFPLPWDRVVLVKNLAAIALTGAFFALVSMGLLFFSPLVPTGRELFYAILYVVTVLFPLLQLGNINSVRHPRRECGMRITDLIEAFWQFVALVLVSIPYYALTSFFSSPLPCMVYAAAAAAFWSRASFRKTAELIEREYQSLCGI